MSMSRTQIETMLWHIQRELMTRYGVDESCRLIYPLSWYITTGRASGEFLQLLQQVRPFLIARDLHKEGSDEQILDRICKRIGYQRIV